jgi:hypothetical protein
MRRTILTAAALALLMSTAAHADILFTTAQVAKVRNGPGVNHNLLDEIPAGNLISASRCVRRDDGIAGADWCLVNYPDSAVARRSPVAGWVSQAVLLPYREAEQEPVQAPTRPNAYAAMPAQPTQVSLKCTPPLDRSDRNPVKAIYVSYVLGAPKLSITVTHEAWNGEMYNRADQYDDAVASYQDGIYGWRGSWMKNRNVIMSGGAFIGNDGRYYYREKQWKNGVTDHDTTSACIEVD